MKSTLVICGLTLVNANIFSTFNLTNVGSKDLVYFGSGISMGSVVELSANTNQWPCINSLSSVLSNGYMMSFYVKEFMKTGENMLLTSLVGYTSQFVTAT